MQKKRAILATSITLAAALLVAVPILITRAFQTETKPAASAPTAARQGGSRVEYASLQSPALGRELRYAVQLPSSYESDKARRYPVLYFLHGLNGTEREFERRGVSAFIDRMREEKKIGEFIIVAPAGENSFYLNAKNGPAYEDALIKDLIPHIEKTYRAVATPQGRAIQGLSMGGYGALLLAFKHPEMFSSVTAHSSALVIELPQPASTDQRSQFRGRLIGKLFGDPPDDAFFRANNPVYLAETNAAAIKKAGLRIYFDVGDQDRYGFQESNKVFDERLTRAGVPHEYHLFPGNHGWEYMLTVADKSYAFLWQDFAGVEKQKGAKAPPR